MADKEKIEKLQAMLAEAKALMDAAAQFAGENNIPLKYIDPDFDPEENGDHEYNHYWDREWSMQFGGQPFRLEKEWNGEKYYWYNSNC